MTRRPTAKYRTELSPSGHPTEFELCRREWWIRRGTSGRIPTLDLDWAEERSVQMTREFRTASQIMRQA